MKGIRMENKLGNLTEEQEEGGIIFLLKCHFYYTDWKEGWKSFLLQGFIISIGVWKWQCKVLDMQP